MIAEHLAEKVPRAERLHRNSAGLAQAQLYLGAIDPDATEFHFRTFDDKKRNDAALRRKFHGTLEEHFAELC